MGLFRGIQEYIALDAKSITLVVLYNPQVYQILCNEYVTHTMTNRNMKSVQ